jgi:hypothetical protein
MYRRLLLMTTVLATLTACSFLESSPDTTTTTTAAAVAGSVPTTALAADLAGAADSPCLAGDRPFASDGVISAFGGANGDAAQISGVRWADHPGCERIVVDLLTSDGAPAGAINPVGVDYNAELGIIRINLPDAITQSAISDSRFDGALVDRVYVVATTDGRVAADVHITPGAAIALRAFEVDSPSRIVIDVRSEEAATPVLGAARTSDTVILSPLPGPASSTVAIAGYAKGPQDELAALIYGAADQQLLVEEAIGLGSATNLWREFGTNVSGLPEMPLLLTVGFEGSTSAAPATVTIDTSTSQLPAPPEV